MQNEGIVTDDSRSLVKSEMIHALRELGPSTPDRWEQEVFRRVTGHGRDEVDWDVEDNHAGYYLWVRSFDQLVTELLEDGYARAEDTDDGRRFVPVASDPSLDVSRLVYPGAAAS